MLRWAKLPGWSVVGGVAAGVLLGPTIFGRVLPREHDAVFEGAVTERQTLVISRMFAEEMALARSADAQSTAQQNESLQRAEDAYRAARWAHQRPLRIFAAVIVAVALLGAAAHAIRFGDKRQGLATPLSIGVWAAALPGGVTFLAALALWRLDTSDASMIAAAVGIGAWAIRDQDRHAAARAELGGARMMQTATRIASVIALAALAWALQRERGIEALAWLAPMLALPIAWALGPALGAPNARRRTAFALVIDAIAIPSLAAVAAIKIELFQHFSLWPIIFIVLLCDDARWLGALLGALAPGGRRTLRTMRLVMGAMAAGPTQLAVTALAAHLQLIPHEFIYALVIGAMVIELTAPLRRSMAASLEQAEDQIARMENDKE